MTLKLNNAARNSIILIICYLHIILFTYAATSKLLDYQNFKIQLGQSPLLSPFAGIVSWAVPSIEFLISLLLAIPKFRLSALFAAFSLMAMFTAYIYIILNYSAFVPCSCGGVLEKMTWDQHLLFNIAFILLSAIAILIYPLADFSKDFKTT